MVIDLPPHIEQLLVAKAKNEQMTVSELIVKWAEQDKKEANPMIEAVMNMKPSSQFQNVDAVALQREWRDEWER